MRSVLLLLLASASALADGDLARCRSLDKAFDTTAMVAPCTEAAADTTLAVRERIEALRRLASAHLLNKEPALADAAFVQMLVLSSTAVLPADAGPDVRDAFEAARARFEDEGRLVVTFVAPDPTTAAPVDVQLDVVDRLGRVANARIVVGRLEERLLRSELAAGQLRFRGTVPEPKEDDGTLSYKIVLDGFDGRAVEMRRGTLVRGVAPPAPPAATEPEVPAIGAAAVVPAPADNTYAVGIAVLATGIGVVALGGGAALAAVSASNEQEWSARAEGKTFPRNGDDPQCSAGDSAIDNCISDGAQVGWTNGYGPKGSKGQVGQGARFMMVAFSADNARRYEELLGRATAVAVGGAVVTAAGSVALTIFVLSQPE